MTAKFLVVRCNNQDGVNPIHEVNQVIDREGYCWFGKYGQRIHTIHAAPPDLQVVLAPASVLTDGKGALYKCGGYSFSQPSPAKGYPAYYKGKLALISTWLKLVPAEHSTIQISELLIKSSLRPLSDGLNHSARGHFWCIDKKPHSRRR